MLVISQDGEIDHLQNTVNPFKEGAVSLMYLTNQHHHVSPRHSLLLSRLRPRGAFYTLYRSREQIPLRVIISEKR